MMSYFTCTVHEVISTCFLINRFHLPIFIVNGYDRRSVLTNIVLIVMFSFSDQPSRRSTKPTYVQIMSSKLIMRTYRCPFG